MNQVITRRRVHYFSGFDPRGPAYYHRLFKEQADKTQPDGSTLHFGRRIRAGTHIHQWTVERTGLDKLVVATEFQFMSWDAIIRAYWPRSALDMLVRGLPRYLKGLTEINLFKIRAVSRGAFWAGVMPLAFFILAIAMLMLSLQAAASATSAGLPESLAMLLGATAFIATGALLLKLADVAGVFWLLRIYRFNLKLSEDQVPELHAQQREWAEAIIRAQQADPVDEVVIVGHSVGTLVLVGAVNALLNDARWIALQRERPTPLLTLGQCLPFATMPDHATRFRDDVRSLCRQQRLSWWDITARADPLCFFLAHPLGSQNQEKLPAPRLRAARFFRIYSDAHWRRIRNNKLLVHFLYLMTPDKDSDFNLNALIYGPRPFEQQLGRLKHDSR